LRIWIRSGSRQQRRTLLIQNLLEFQADDPGIVVHSRADHTAPYLFDLYPQATRHLERQQCVLTLDNFSSAAVIGNPGNYLQKPCRFARFNHPCVSCPEIGPAYGLLTINGLHTIKTGRQNFVSNRVSERSSGTRAES
jgi:hypothetical protein